MPDIYLINPPFAGKQAFGNTKAMELVLNIIPPLGLAYLAAALEKGGYKVGIVDCSVEKDIPLALKRVIDDKPRMIGITASTPAFESAKELCSGLKDALPESFFVLGGAHVTALPFLAMQSSQFDAGVIGEGEETIVELAQKIMPEHKSGLRQVKGIFFREGQEFVKTEPRGYIQNLDSLSFPARNLLPSLDRYRPTPASYKKLPLGIIISSRGCPGQCSFCDRAVFGNHYRKRSADNVLAEVKEVIGTYGAREIRFFDDCFALDEKRTFEICAGLRKLKPAIPWTCLTTVGSVSKELLREMKHSGCWQVLFGLESGDEEMLKRLKKGANLDDNLNAVRWAREAGLSVRADFIVGTPGETPKSLERSLQWAIASGVDYAHFNKFVPYPGTELYEDLVSQGMKFDFSAPCSITDHSNTMFVPKGLPGKEWYLRFLDRAHRAFYLRPGYMLKRFLSLRTFDELTGQVKGFFSICLLGTKTQEVR